MIDWEGFGGVWKVLEGWIHRDCLILRSSDVFSFLDTSGLPDFMEFRCILFWDTSESDILVESRCIRNVWSLEHTSETPELGPFRCIITLVSVGDTSGLKFQSPSRCTKVQIYLDNTSG